MVFENPYTSAEEKIDALQRWIIFHSVVYYITDEIVVTDKVFDANCRQLLRLQDDFKEAYKASRYYYIFKDFDGSTGFDIPYKLSPEDKEKIIWDINFFFKRIKRREICLRDF